MAHKEQVIIENKKENEVMSVGLDTVNNVESLVKKLAKNQRSSKNICYIYSRAGR